MNRFMEKLSGNYSFCYGQDVASFLIVGYGCVMLTKAPLYGLALVNQYTNIAIIAQQNT